MPRTVAERVDDPRHAGALAGADAVGEASGGGRLVRIGVWREGARIARARFRATSCASLIAYADAACEALERGAPPERLDADAVRALLDGVHPVHLDRAALVAAGVRQATLARGAPAAAPSFPAGGGAPA